MNSDPTGYFTLFEMSAVLNIQSKIKTASVSAAIGGLMSMMDALLGGERDPLNLVKSFASGAITGALVGAVFGKLTAVANAGGAYANVALMTKLGLASLGVGLGGISTAQSFSEGKNLQGIFRGISTAIGVHGLKKAFGSAMASFKGSGSGNSVASNEVLPGEVDSDVWDMTEGGGIINGREYSQHAMERMAPDTPAVRAELSRRAEALAGSKGLQVGTPEYYQLFQKYVDPRNIPPSVIEYTIRNTTADPGDTAGTFVHQTVDVKVIVNEMGKVITAMRK